MKKTRNTTTNPLSSTKILYNQLTNASQNILYKTLFATNFIENTCKFYNFVGNDYPRRNYLPIKILRKNGRKKSFLTNFFNKFARKVPCNMGISSSDFLYEYLLNVPKLLEYVGLLS